MKIFRLFLILIVAAFATRCTHNNGDIGPLFGQWIMTDITADGERPADVIATNWNWRFQNAVLLISEVDYLGHEYSQYWASWEREGQTLRINYNNTDPAITWAYDFPSAIGFTQATTYTLTIESESSSQMTLRMVNPDGITYVYTLKKH